MIFADNYTYEKTKKCKISMNVDFESIRLGIFCVKIIWQPTKPHSRKSNSHITLKPRIEALNCAERDCDISNFFSSSQQEDKYSSQWTEERFVFL